MSRDRATLLRRGSVVLVLLFLGVSTVVMLTRWQSLLTLCVDWWHRRPFLTALSAGIALLVVAGALNLFRVAASELRAHLVWKKMLGAHDVRVSGGGVFVVQSGQFFVFTQGLAHPRTYCSSTFLRVSTPRERMAVLEHEAAHRSRRDPLRKILWHLLSATLFFLPLLKTLERSALTDEECRADAAAVAAGHDPCALLAAVRRAVQHGGTLPFRLASVAFAASPDLLVRCRVLAGEPVSRRASPRALLTTSAILATILGSMVLMPKSSNAVEQNICRRTSMLERNRSVLPSGMDVPASRVPVNTVLLRSEPSDILNRVVE